MCMHCVYNVIVYVKLYESILITYPFFLICICISTHQAVSRLVTEARRSGINLPEGDQARWVIYTTTMCHVLPQ